MQVGEVDLAEAVQLDLRRQLRLNRARELRLGHVPLLERVQRMLATFLRRLLQGRPEHPRIGTDALVPGGERLPQRVRQNPAEVRDDRLDRAHAAAGAGSRTVSSYNPAPLWVSIRQSMTASCTSRPSSASDAPAVRVPK